MTEFFTLTHTNTSNEKHIRESMFRIFSILVKSRARHLRALNDSNCFTVEGSMFTADQGRTFLIYPILYSFRTPFLCIFGWQLDLGQVINFSSFVHKTKCFG